MNNKWQPIDTAPKNGVAINVKWNSADGDRVDTAKWNGELWVTNVINNLSGLPFICRNIVGWSLLSKK